jgi:hypothetical protein
MQTHNQAVKPIGFEPISRKGAQRIEHTIEKEHRRFITFCKI